MSDEIGSLIRRYRRTQRLSIAEAAERWRMTRTMLEALERQGGDRSTAGLLEALLRDAIRHVEAVDAEAGGELLGGARSR